ncbi:MAG TPA: DnaJ domain-containing protein [Firmicutes bacterium]|nr:DnaJ domain-containing protein [Bacillota bacterium]
MENPYEVLGIEEDASIEEIKRAYLKLIRKFAPERHPDEFKRIRAAYEQLKDQRARAEVDVFRLNLDEKALIRFFDYSRTVPKLDPLEEAGHVIAWVSDLDRIDFERDFTRMPWEKRAG